MLERHITFYGQAPRQAAADRCFASLANLSQAKAWGVRDMAFHKKGGAQNRGRGQESLGLPQVQELPRLREAYTRTGCNLARLSHCAFPDCPVTKQCRSLRRLVWHMAD